MPSYASDGKADQDIFLSSALEFDQETGVALPHEGEYARTAGGLYLRSKVRLLMSSVPLCRDPTRLDLEFAHRRRQRGTSDIGNSPPTANDLPASR